MFGVGAAAARLEADRKVQLTLRRVSVLILATEVDNFTAEISSIQRRLEDLLGTTSVSSPSSVTRAEVLMLLRALVLKTSAIHLAPFWPMITGELHNALSEISPTLNTKRKHAETYNPYSLLQACKLLEVLLLTSPDDFQVQQWLLVNDTIDAVHPPLQGTTGTDSTALADYISQTLDLERGNGVGLADDASSSLEQLRRSPESATKFSGNELRDD
ncbi:hypothetical protein KEM54_004640, partial [Ascosphaera aggregata]